MQQQEGKEEEDEEEKEEEEVEEVDIQNHLKNQPFFAFSRIYSGTIKVGQRVNVLGPRYSPLYPEEHRTEIEIKELYLLMGRDIIPVDEVPAGNIFGIGGLSHVVYKTATISSTPFAPVFSVMHFSAAPIIRIAIEPRDASHLPNLIFGLQLLNLNDPSVVVSTQESGEQIILTAGEVHAERCLKDLEELYARVPLIVSPPLVSFRETIVPDKESAEGNDKKKIAHAYTSDKTCRFSMQAVPMPEPIVSYIAKNERYLKKCIKGDLDADHPQRVRVFEGLKEVFTKCGWEEEYKNLWALGPGHYGPNLLINDVKEYNSSTIFRSVHDRYLLNKPAQPVPSSLTKEERKQDKTGAKAYARELLRFCHRFNNRIIAGFQQASKEGPLCNEPLYGVCFKFSKISNVFIKSKIREAMKNKHDDVEGDDEQIVQYDNQSVGTIGGQVLAAMNACCKNSFDLCNRRLVEAFYYCELIVSEKGIGPACKVLKARRANILAQDIEHGTGQYVIKCHLPIAESFGFSDDLRNETHGASRANIMFSHWGILDIDPFFKPTTEDELEEFGSEDLWEQYNIAKKYVNEVRERKGLMVEKLLVTDGDKNRNLSKKK